MFRLTWVRRSLGVLVALLVLVLVIELGGGRYAKTRAIDTASRHGLKIAIGSARVGFFSVVLKNIDGGLAGDDALRFSLSEIRVSVSSGLAIENVVVQGGEVTATGDLAHLREALSPKKPIETDTSPNKAAVRLRIDGLRASWRDKAESVVLEGVSATKDGSAVGIHVSRGTIAGARANANLDTLHVTLETGLAKTTIVSASKVELVVRSDHPTGDTSAPRPSTTENANAPLFPFARLRTTRDAFDTGILLVAAKVQSPVEAKIDGFEVTIQEAKDKTTFGPGPLTFRRTDAQLSATYTSLPLPGITPLSLALSIPVSPGKVGDVRVHLDGGPVSGKLFGLREGVFGLTDLDRTQLEGRADLVWTEGGSALSFDGHVNAKGVSIVQPRLSKEAITGLDVGLRGRGLATASGELRVDELEASLGALRILLRGSFQEDGARLRGNLAFSAPLAGCGALLDSVPVALRPALRGATMSGTLGATGRVAFDTANLDDFVLDYDVRDSCRFTSVPEQLARERYMRVFTHRIYHPDGTIGEETTGPGSEHWTPLDRISPFMQVAVLTTEDGSFRRHRGFNHRAIRDSLVANLKAKRFLRGASTITMQLAKNLFLTREKTLARKLEEIILTDYLEQTWDKDEMLELYFNVVEFGPDVYGITKAADYYFGRKPEELNLAECMFLASVLPAPLRIGKFREKGDLPPHQRKTLDTLMRIALKTGKVSPSELAEGLGASLTFVKPGSPRPTPRPPAHGSRFEEPEADPAWEPVKGE